MDKRRKKRVWFLTVLATVAALSLFVFSGCAKLASAINDIKGSLIGNQYTIYTYDNFGNLVLETSGKKIDIAGNPVKNTSYDETARLLPDMNYHLLSQSLLMAMRLSHVAIPASLCKKD